MDKLTGSTDSLWHNANITLSFPSVTEDIQTDVCVVGAGITGLTCAYLLLKEGKSVVIIDDGEIGGGETLYTTAHLSNALADRYYKIAFYHGEKGAQLAAKSHSRAIDRIEQICRDEKINCDFSRVDGFLFFAKDEDIKAEKELVATNKAGILTQLGLYNIPYLSDGKILHFPDQAQFHPGKYLAGLSKAIENMGGKIFTKTHAVQINETEGSVYVTSKEGNTISSKKVIVATNTPISDWIKISMKQYPYRTYVVGIKIPTGSVPQGLYRDSLDPYHYVRVYSGDDGDILLVGGEDRRAGEKLDEELERYQHLEQRAREHYTDLGEVVYHRSGQCMESADCLAYIGHEPEGKSEHIYIATGDSGNGLTHGTIAGILITDMIMGRANELEKLYDPKRITLRASMTMMEEGFNTMLQYADYLTPGDVKERDEIKPGEGAIVREGLEKKAVYRDEKGKLHERCATCPHLGALVRRNQIEKTRDCPAHGSRFDCIGKVINGPANDDLKPCEEK